MNLEDNMDTPMQLIDSEKEKLLTAKDEKEWYALCDEIKTRRNGQYPSYLSREILDLYQKQFPVKLS